MIKPKEFVTIRDGRVHEVWSYWFSLLAKDQDSWGKLLNTNKFKKREVHSHIVARHGHWAIRRLLKANNINWVKWEIIRKGSDGRIV